MILQINPSVMHHQVSTCYFYGDQGFLFKPTSNMSFKRRVRLTRLLLLNVVDQLFLNILTTGNTAPVLTCNVVIGDKVSPLALAAVSPYHFQLFSTPSLLPLKTLYNYVHP